MNDIRQLRGSFKQGEVLISNSTVKHLGIQAKSGTTFIMNGNEFEIGITNIYEIGQIFITALYFNKDINSAIIDYVIEI